MLHQSYTISMLACTIPILENMLQDSLNHPWLFIHPFTLRSLQSERNKGKGCTFFSLFHYHSHRVELPPVAVAPAFHSLGVIPAIYRCNIYGKTTPTTRDTSVVLRGIWVVSHAQAWFSRITGYQGPARSTGPYELDL